MSHRTCWAVVGACVTAAGVAVSAPCQEPPAEKKDQPPAAAGEQGRGEAERVVRKVEVESFVNDAWVKAELAEKPLLFYGDSTRENDRGSVWAWGTKGRPVALVELYQNTADRGHWVYVLCNTGGGRVRARLNGNLWWSANDSASELKDVPGAPAPAADPALRQRQLKQIAQKFTGHQFWDPNNTRYELRRLDRPLHAYRDEAAGLLDGALFTLANGTNPELLLFLEARADPADATKAAWRYAVGRLAHAELHLEYDGREVFEAPRGDKLSGRTRPYWLGLIRLKPADDPAKP